MRQRLLRSLLALTLGLLIAGVTGYNLLWHWHTQQPVRLADTATEDSNLDPFLLTIPRGAHSGRIIQHLTELGIVEQPWWHRLSVRLFEHAGQIQAGVYAIKPGDSPADLWRRFTRGEQHLFRITLVEGQTFAQWRQKLAQHPYIRSTLEQLEATEIMQQLVAEPLAEHPEGLFFPDTYQFYAGTSDQTLLRRAHQRMTDELTELWQQRASDLPIDSPYEALVLASIVERETGQPAERPLVASVFMNRLRQGMRLQSDPTIIYGLGERYQGIIYRRDIQEHTPYNTYRIDGLPPTPIGMPGFGALAATLQPAATDYLYFVSRNDGTHVFSTNLADHNRAVQRYQR